MKKTLKRLKEFFITTTIGKLLLCLFVALSCFIGYVLWDYQKHLKPSNYDRILHLINLFVEHFWIEIISGVFIWGLLESTIKKYGAIPFPVGKRNYKRIFDAILKEPRSKIMIIDNNIISFYNEIDQINTKLIEILKSLPPNTNEKDPPFQILLLHPNTSAAKQRNQDLFHNGGLEKESDLYKYDLFKLMKDGLKKLHYTLDLLERDDKEKIRSENEKLRSRIEVKLFQTSHSLVFIAWDNYMNFGIIPPNSSTDSNTFIMNRDSHLADYFNGNFKAIWKDDKSIKLEDYKYIKIKVENEESGKYDKVYWGADSHNHELPIYFLFNDEDKAKSLINQLNLNGNNPNTGNAKIVHIIHNNKMQLAEIELVDGNEKPNNVTKTLYEFATDQIKGNYESFFLNSADYMVFKIRYKYDSRRINLMEDNYVKQYLDARSYCHVPHTKFDVSLGMRLKNSLTCLYNFFTTDFGKYYQGLCDSKKAYTKGVVIQYECTIDVNNVIKAKPIKSEDKITKKIKGNFPNLLINDLDIDNKGLERFITSTVESDLYHISGHKYKLNEGKKKSKEFDVIVHLIQSKVYNSDSERYIATDLTDIDNAKYDEHTASIVVVHMAGKRNVFGGINSLFMCETENEITENGKAEKVYNLKTVLDSIYYKHEVEHDDNKGKFIIGKSSGIRFNPNEVKSRMKSNNFETDEKNEAGYRNVIAIEFFER